MKQVLATVLSNDKLVSKTKRYPRNTLGSNLIWLRCPEFIEEATPGKFVMVTCGSDTVLPRPFSIHQVDKDSIAIFYTVWSGGKGTEWLSQRSTSDKIELFGLLGNGFNANSASQKLLLVAAGMGIAPLYFLAQQQLQYGKSVTLLYGTRTEHRYPGSLLPSGLKLVATSDDGSVGYQGLITDIIPEYAEWADQVFACGPLPMYKTMSEMPELGNKPIQVSLEIMMGCGRGICYGCTIKTKTGLKKVCKQGPVFDLNDIIWDELSP